MSGETENQVSGWTVDTLHSHVERIFDERDHRYEERFTASQTALTTALDSLNKRLDGLNELRSGVATTAEVDAVKLLLADLKERVDKNEGQDAGVKLSTGVLVTAVTVGVLVIGLVVTVANVLTGG